MVEMQIFMDCHSKLENEELGYKAIKARLELTDMSMFGQHYESGQILTDHFVLDGVIFHNELSDLVENSH